MKLSLFQTILFIVFGLAALVGLFVFANYTNNSGRDGIGTVTIWGTLPQEGMESLLVLLGQTNSELRNVTYVEKDALSLPGELASAIATGAPPDVVLDSQENLLSLAKYLMPIPFDTLSTSAFTSTFVGGAGIFMGPEGYFGVPFLVDPLVLYSNRSILASSGIAAPPATWEALTGLVPRIAKLTPNRQISRALIALGSYDNVHNARSILSTLFLQTTVPISAYSATGVLTADLGASSSDGRAPGLAVITFYTQFVDPSKVSYTWNAAMPDSQRAFVTTDEALYLGHLSEASFIRSANPNIELLVTPVPQPATASVKVAYGRIYAFMIPRGAANPDGGYKVAALLAGSSEQQAASATLRLPPANLSNLATLPTDPALAVGYEEALYTKGWLSPAPLATDRVFSDMINAVITGRYEFDTALTVAARAMSAALSR